MSEIIRNRWIRPSSRLASSKSYKIDTKAVTENDTLIVNIYHESDENFFESYRFSGKKVAHKNSISFSVNDDGLGIRISWSGAESDGRPIRDKSKAITKPPEQKPSSIDIPINEPLTEGHIQGLDPIIDNKSTVLILGTMPGADSLEKQQYYGHNRNNFWHLMEQVLNMKFPADYEKRKKLLLDNGIALWDVCKSCIREGSLDENISDEVPNDIRALKEEYPTIKAIAFNGKKAAQQFGKHIRSVPDVRLLVLPSSSPANAGIKMEVKEMEWGKVKAYLKPNKK